MFEYPLKRLGQFELPEPIRDYEINKKDQGILRELAYKKAQIAALFIHNEKIKLWKDLNSLSKSRQRPLVWINEVPWHELN